MAHYRTLDFITLKTGDTERVEKMTKANKEQSELEKKMWEDEKEATAARLKKLNEEVEQNGKLLKEALDNMPTAGTLLLFECIPEAFLSSPSACLRSGASRNRDNWSFFSSFLSASKLFWNFLSFLVFCIFCIFSFF